MESYNIVLLEGDGIGPEVLNEGLKVLLKAAKIYNFNINYEYAYIGGAAIDKTLEPLPELTLSKCKQGDAVLLGAVGGPKWDNLASDKRPEAGLLFIRKELGLFANLRHVHVFNGLEYKSAIKHNAKDIMIVRELTGGIYFGEKGRTEKNGNILAYDVEMYTQLEIKRIAKVAFDLAMKRKKQLCSVDKANVLESSRLWREIVTKMALEYPEVELTHMHVDNCAMQLILAPENFDVILTSNMFGDILSDEASMLSGSIGMLPSASIGTNSYGLYEPIHGSAPQIAGKNIANPIATILSVAMMLRYSFGQIEAASGIEAAVQNAIKSSRTYDIYQEGTKRVSCSDMGDIVCKNIF